MTDTCSSCRFRHPDQRPEYADSGECRRRAPQVASWTHPAYDGPQYEQHWPWMASDDWCGEWEAKAAGEPEAGPTLPPFAAPRGPCTICGGDYATCPCDDLPF